MHRLKSAGLLVLAVAAAAPAAARAQDTTRTGVRIGLFYAPGVKPGVVVLPAAGAAGDSVRAILERDLDYGDRVTVVRLDEAAGALSGPRGLNYDLFAKLGAAAVIQPTLTPAGLRLALHDVAKRQVAQARDFPLAGAPSAREWRMDLHRAADDAELWITGTRGIAATRVAFVRGGQVWVVDSDGVGEQAVTSGGRALSPSWHPSGRYLAYASMSETGTRVLVRDLATGSTRQVAGSARGLNITPTWSPDGGAIAYAHGEESGTDLMLAPSFGEGGARPITVGRGTENTSPSFSPDGRQVAFMSGRSGHPEVYISDVDGTNAELLTPYVYGERSYRASPDWSPANQAVAFQSEIGGNFQIMTIGLRDRAMKQHTSEGVNEDPSWAPDGRHLVFTSTRTGTRQLFVLDTESGRVRQLTKGGGTRLSAWSRALTRAQ
ncbi:MAG: hypothetical protein ACJ8AO_08515 [Gemmatimonadaceae bacterium]